jgi:NAD(P)-dependent dehydrogenase (short-subunit alcohol dehydrogenase family)
VGISPNEEWGLIGKVAIVTGGGAEGDGIGNGRGAAILLARAGAHVLVVDQRLERAEGTVKMITGEGGSAVAASYDVTNAAQCAAMVQDALSRWGRIDCLHNNVGFGNRGTVVTESEANWDRVMRGNVDSVFLVSKHVVPAMIRGGGGAIVNTASVSALRPHPDDGGGSRPRQHPGQLRAAGPDVYAGGLRSRRHDHGNARDPPQVIDPGA